MILVLTGPTGSGKTALALELAKRLGAAIVNADAFQVYQELSIATAKPTLTERSLAPHYLFDFVPLTSGYNVAEYQADLRSVLGYCLGQGQNVIIAGGTGLYIKAGLYDYEFSPRAEVDLSRYEGYDNDALYAELLALDKDSAAAIHPHNRQRVLRALSLALSGETKSSLEARQEHKPLYEAMFFGLNQERDRLYERVDARVERMFAEGLLEETLPLIERYGRNAMAFRAIGVKELFPYIDGSATLEQTKELIKKNTRNYVKRQMTWFRHQFDLTWVDSAEDILRRIV